MSQSDCSQKAIQSNSKKVSYTAEEYERRTYEDLSNELQEIYPVAARSFELIPLMYNRLTLVDELTHKDAVEKIIADHHHFSGFSARNIRRYLPSDNPTVPKRIRPSWPKNSIIGTESPPQLSNTEQENNTKTELQHQNESIICSSDDKQKSIIDFEFSLPWDDVHQYMGLKFKKDGSFAKVWFNGRIDIQTGRVITASVGSISDSKH
jgi:hypothetical protein